MAEEKQERLRLQHVHVRACAHIFVSLLQQQDVCYPLELEREKSLFFAVECRAGGSASQVWGFPSGMFLTSWGSYEFSTDVEL